MELAAFCKVVSRELDTLVSSMFQGNIRDFTCCTNTAPLSLSTTPRSKSVVVDGGVVWGSNLLGKGVEFTTARKQKLAVNLGFGITAVLVYVVV
jgi:hypothetical protein